MIEATEILICREIKTEFSAFRIKKKKTIQHLFSELVPVQIVILAFCVFVSFLVLTIIHLVSTKYC